MGHRFAYTVYSISGRFNRSSSYRGGLGNVRELAAILGRVDLGINIWYTHALAIRERRARLVKYIVGGLGLLMAPFLLPLVAFAAMVYIVSAVFSDNTGDKSDG